MTDDPARASRGSTCSPPRGAGRAPRPVRPAARRGARVLAPGAGRHRLLGDHQARRRAGGQPRQRDVLLRARRHVHPDGRTRRRSRTLRLTILNMDPPKHNRYRRLVSKGFTPADDHRSSVEEIERRAAAVVDDVCEKGEVEFVEEIAAQVPVQMICEMIGLEPEVWPRMFELSNQLIGSRDDPDYQELAGRPAGGRDRGLHAVRRGGRRPPRRTRATTS